jgi:DNA polymerase III gamma/tau subunit
MDIKFTAFLYSKFSQNSKNFSQLLERIPNDFKNNIKFNSLCVDNENIRKTVLNSKQFDIKNVPCVLVTYNDGHVEKFEGSDAFKWADDIIVKINHKAQIEQQMIQQYQQNNLQQHPVQQHHVSQHPVQQHPSHHSVQQHPSQHPSQHSVNYHLQNQVETQVNPQSHKVKRKQKTKKIVEIQEESDEESDEESEVQIKRKPKNKGKTSIEDIDTEDETDFISDLQKNIETHPEMKQKEGSNALNAKKESLMSAAMAMQKNRESYDKNLKNPQMINLGR